MLLHKSTILSLGMCFSGGLAMIGAQRTAVAADHLPEVSFVVDTPAVGTEKACSDKLPTPGVSFPTVNYQRHSSAYHRRQVITGVVQAGALCELSGDGSQKSTDEFPCRLQDSRGLARLDAAEAVEVMTVVRGVSVIDYGANSDSGNAAEDSMSAARAWRAVRPVSELRAELEPLVAESVEDHEPAAGVSRNLHAVTASFQDSDIPSLPDMSADDPVAGPSSFPQPVPIPDPSRLFRRLDGIKLGTAIHDESTLPESGNSARDVMNRAGTQYNWSSGTWVSFRPPRDTFPMHSNPLYFEDPNLERCGRSHGHFTEVVSIANFAARVPMLPYMMTVEPPCSVVPVKPDCPTCSKFGPDAYFPNPDEVDLGAATVQAAFIIGLAFLLP